MPARIAQLNVLPRAAAVLVGVRAAAEQRRRVGLFGRLVETAVKARPPIVRFIHIARAVLHTDNWKTKQKRRFELMNKEKNGLIVRVICIQLSRTTY